MREPGPSQSEIIRSELIEDMERELTALRSDIERHVQAAADLANEVADLRAMLSDDPHNVPSAFVQFGGVTYRVWGTSSISTFEKMQAQLAELRAENERLREGLPQMGAPEGFVEYVVSNYPPRTIISDPAWHAPKLWRAALREVVAAIDAARKEGK